VVVLVVGGVITVSFTYLFGLKSNVADALIVAALTLAIILPSRDTPTQTKRGRATRDTDPLLDL
jgi:Flp pilus assembly protein TadG